MIPNLPPQPRRSWRSLQSHLNRRRPALGVALCAAIAVVACHDSVVQPLHMLTPVGSRHSAADAGEVAPPDISVTASLGENVVLGYYPQRTKVVATISGSSTISDGVIVSVAGLEGAISGAGGEVSLNSDLPGLSAGNHAETSMTATIDVQGSVYLGQRGQTIFVGADGRPWTMTGSARGSVTRVVATLGIGVQYRDGYTTDSTWTFFPGYSIRLLARSVGGQTLAGADPASWMFYPADGSPPTPACTAVTRTWCDVSPMTSGTVKMMGYANGGPAVPASIFIDVPLDLSLECPASVKRGSSVTCTATGAAVTGWNFAGSVNGVPWGKARATNQTAKSWSGAMAVSGTVTVTGSAGMSASRTISVDARTWDSTQVPHQVIQKGQGPATNQGLASKLVDPPTSLSRLGTTYTRAVYLPGYPTLFSPITDGPNEGLVYARGIPVRVVSEVLVNTAAMTSGSVWWGMQAQTRSGNGCARSDVVNLLSEVQRHEGAVPDPYSHVNTLYTAYVDGLTTMIEPFVRVAPVDLSEIDAKITIVQSIARSNSKAITDDSVYNPSTTSCTFKF